MLRGIADTVYWIVRRVAPGSTRRAGSRLRRGGRSSGPSEDRLHRVLCIDCRNDLSAALDDDQTTCPRCGEMIPAEQIRWWREQTNGGRETR